MRLCPSARALALTLSLVTAFPAWAGDLEDAQALRDKGKWEEALAKYEKAAAAEPTNAAAALGRSDAYLALGKYHEAASSLSAALDANPKDVSLLLARSRAYEAIMRKSIAEEGDDNTVRGYAGDTAKWASAALEVDPKSADAMVLVGKARVAEGAAAEANKLFADAVAADPKHFDAHWELGQAAIRAARADKATAKIAWANAERHFRNAAAADPKSGDALLEVAYAKQWQGLAMAPEFVKDYLAAARLMPNDARPLSRIWRLRTSKNPGSREAALAAFTELGTPKAKAYLLGMEGQQALKDGKTQQADDIFVKAIDTWDDPAAKESTDLYDAINADAYLAADLSGAQRDKVWTALWKKWPARFEAPNNAGLWHRDRDHDYKASAEWYVRAAAVAPDSPQVLNDTGLIYKFHLSDNKKAEKYFRAAIKAAQDNQVEWSNDGQRKPEGMGFRDALNNLASILGSEKRWADLKELAELDAPKNFPGRKAWLQSAEEQKWEQPGR